MNCLIVRRVLDEAYYMLNTNKTIREISSVFNVSKSTVHKDLHERLKDINFELYEQIDDILKCHLDVRHIRGGESTKKKYKKLI
jgi:putative DeoR family transcriptional regulator (stage III sporulation protein D)